jgi:thioredoxin reductase/NAD-dependent dihydropyrimidine dehydrogenase PreA subunit
MDILMYEELIEEIITYSLFGIIIVGLILYYIRKQKHKTQLITEKIEIAKNDGTYEPVSLYPVVDTSRCINSGACIKACPEHDILGIQNGKATIINAAQCIGHGACFRACPVEAISLWIGTERRGVELPHVSPDFETNVPGIFIAGELGGMGLIRNAVTQGREAVESIIKKIDKNHKATYDLVIVGAGPAGISATLAAKKAGLKTLTLEQDTLGGTVYTYPRSKIIMTHPMDLPLYGKVKLKETSKDELLNLWIKVLQENNISIQENTKIEAINRVGNEFEIETLNGEKITTKTVLLALGRRGTPRKLGVEGEMSQKVAYRLLEPELIQNKKVLVVGGGDSAVESALLLANKNTVTLSYRSEKFSRLKTKNAELIKNAALTGLVDIQYSTEVIAINEKQVHLINKITNENIAIDNDMVYIFAGGELPNGFLKKCGIQVNLKQGEVVMKH